MSHGDRASKERSSIPPKVKDLIAEIFAIPQTATPSTGSPRTRRPTVKLPTSEGSTSPTSTNASPQQPVQSPGVPAPNTSARNRVVRRLPTSSKNPDATGEPTTPAPPPPVAESPKEPSMRKSRRIPRTESSTSGNSSSPMSADDLTKFSTELEKILSLTGKGMQEWANEGGSRDAPAVSALVEAVKRLAEVNGALWKEIYNRRGAGMQEELMGCVGRMEGVVGVEKSSEGRGEGRVDDWGGIAGDIAA